MTGFWGDHLAEEGLVLGVRYLTLTLIEHVPLRKSRQKAAKGGLGHSFEAKHAL